MHFRLALLLFILANISFAVEPVNLTYAVPVVIILVTIFIAAMSMLATAIADPRLEAWAKTELRELFAGVILIALVTAFFLSSSGISVALTGETDYIQVAKDTMDNWISEYDHAFITIMRAAAKIRIAATYSPYMNIPLWYVSISYSTNPLGGVGILLGTLNVASSALTNAMFIAEGMRMMIVFMQVAAPTVLLPLSFILRLIPFSRRIGNTMIAVTLAGMIFFPFGVILADNLNGSIDMPNPTINLNSLDANPGVMIAFEPLCESEAIRVLLSLTDVVFALLVCLPLLFTPWTAGFYPACYNIVKEIVYPLINVIFQLAGTALMLAWDIAYSAGLGRDYAVGAFQALETFLTAVNNLVLIGYIDFILIAIITIAGARSLSTALGGEWYMAGVQRLI